MTLEQLIKILSDLSEKEKTYKVYFSSIHDEVASPINSIRSYHDTILITDDKSDHPLNIKPH